jgi:antitoxin VapB
MLAAKNLGGVLLNSQHNFAWATAGASNGIDASRENGAASILICRDGKRFVLASRIEMPRILAEEISATDFEPIEFAWEVEKAESAFLTNRARFLLEKGETLGADLFLNTETPVVEGDIASCRYQLTAPEIERFQLLGKDTGAVIGDLIQTLRGGESELEIASQTSYGLAAKNIRSVVTLVAADERLEKFRHPVPTKKRWEKLLMIVVCAKREGLIASLSRIICAGNIPVDLANKTKACAVVNAKLQAATKPKTNGVELYRIATDAYNKAGFASEINLHHQGGATGYKTRDWTAHPASSETVKINQAFAWNPSISGTKTEETCIVFEGGIEVITATPNFPQISVEIEGRKYLSPDILSL